MFQSVYESLPSSVRRPRGAAQTCASASASELRTLPARIEICPPAIKRRSADDDSWREQLGRWIDTAWPGLLAATRVADSSKLMRGPVPLEGVRHEFTQSLVDIRTAPARSMLYRIDEVRSLHELWHLRPEVFNLVSRHHDQAEAASRLARLNRHFPTRAPRSGLGSVADSHFVGAPRKSILPSSTPLWRSKA